MIDKKLISTYAAVIMITLLGLLAIKEFNISYPLTLTTASKSSELSVVGEGKVEVIPDTATIDVGISVNKAGSVNEAQQAIDTVNNNIIKEMKALSIQAKDIKTSNYSINPNYAYDRGNQIDGYNAFATVTIKTHNTQLVSQIVSKATTAGANQINGIQFSVADPATFREQARQKAIDNAKLQAEKLSNQLGIKLGKVTNIIESSPGDSYLMPMKAYAESSGGGGGAPDIQPGSQEISSVVTLYFEKR